MVNSNSRRNGSRQNESRRNGKLVCILGGVHKSYNSLSPLLYYEHRSQLAAVEWESHNHNTSRIATLQVDLNFPLNFTQIMCESRV